MLEIKKKVFSAPSLFSVLAIGSTLIYRIYILSMSYRQDTSLYQGAYEQFHI